VPLKKTALASAPADFGQRYHPGFTSSPLFFLWYIYIEERFVSNYGYAHSEGETAPVSDTMLAMKGKVTFTYA
jgi:hypothetical protein